MRKFIQIELDNLDSFREKLLLWVKRFPVFSFLNSNEWPDSENNLLVAVDALEEIIPVKNSFGAVKGFHKQKNDWLFGFLSYDLKNETEHLTSGNYDGIGFPQMHFFQPRYLFRISPSGMLEIGFLPHYSTEKEINDLLTEIHSMPMQELNSFTVTSIHQRVAKEEYIQTVNKILAHIRRGDIYEMNYCMEFFANGEQKNPTEVFQRLNHASRTPFSCLYRMQDKYLMCASPERFLKKTAEKIISQPIKGTAKRGGTDTEDTQIQQLLSQNKKEKSENVMIVDLVRNDLSKTCNPVNAENLYHISTFKQWHQMVSTVSGKIRDGIHFTEVIKNAFPMGSMTGTPKVRAMELIEKYEESKRGLYAGATGYIKPNGDFDFNVVIRSILYNHASNYLSFQVGSAITANSVPEKEYDECLLKAKGMFEALNVPHPELVEKETILL